MRYVIAVDPATVTGIAVVSYSGSEIKVVHSGVVKLGSDRNFWIKTAIEEMTASRNECSESRGLVVLVEDWARHLAYSTAKKLAQIQQVWIDAAAVCGIPVIMVPVLKWQVPAGINKVRDKRDGKGARKKACVDWVCNEYGIETVNHNVADALCMAAIWIRGKEMS